jgi:hypothetical protein
MRHSKSHYYINPISGRVIKSTGKLYKELKKKRFKTDKDACLYNITSAKRCINTHL